MPFRFDSLACHHSRSLSWCSAVHCSGAPRALSLPGRSAGGWRLLARAVPDGLSPGSAWPMFGALALGAPLGTALYSAGGFASVAIATTLMPLVTVLLVAPLSPVPSQCEARPPLKTVAAAVWLPGFGSALSSIGFGAIIAFGSLLAAQRGWTPVWLVFTAFAVSLVAARLLFGHVPDQLGGAKVALVCVLFEAAGLALIWLATDRTTAAAGAALAGFGYALVYPGLGVEVVRRAPSQSRGLAMGAYTVFLDVALGFGSPVLGLIASRFGFDTAFLASALIALGAATFSIRLLFTGRFKRREQCLTSS